LMMRESGGRDVSACVRGRRGARMGRGCVQCRNAGWRGRGTHPSWELVAEVEEAAEGGRRERVSTAEATKARRAAWRAARGRAHALPVLKKPPMMMPFSTCGRAFTRRGGHSVSRGQAGRRRRLFATADGRCAAHGHSHAARRARAIM
jgi:hypothetical protein